LPKWLQFADCRENGLKRRYYAFMREKQAIAISKYSKSQVAKMTAADKS
jgi:hypothetical protein